MDLELNNRHMKYLLLTVIMTVFCLQSYAEEPGAEKKEIKTSVKIKGIVVDSHSSKSLTGVEVKVLGSENVSVLTGFDGEFEITELPPGEYTLQINYISYKKRILRSVKPNDGIIKIELKQESAVTPVEKNKSLPRA